METAENTPVLESSLKDTRGQRLSDVYAPGLLNRLKEDHRVPVAAFNSTL